MLGDQLIGTPRLAVFELVKNAYDADATNVAVRMSNLETKNASITVTDNGQGMSFDTIRNIWLVPGDDHRERQRRALVRSKLGRLPLGEKGLGRFSAHKLGDRIRVTTRAKNQPEYVISIDWRELTKKPFLDEAPIDIAERQPQRFTGTTTGTEIHIDQLRPPSWTRGEVRRLQRQIISMCSPFATPDDFRATLELAGNEPWLDDVLDIDQILKRAFYVFKFTFSDGKLDWTYKFTPAGLPIEGRAKRSGKNERLQLPKSETKEGVVANDAYIDGIGPVSGEFHIFDRERQLLRRLPGLQSVENYLDENGGVRVYRDGIRVYNYGEAGDDWLGLDLRRVNRPTIGISRNLVIGAVHLKLEQSSQLVEKTNREGFVENDALHRLKNVVLGALSKFESERTLDKNRLRALEGAPENREAIVAPVADLRRVLQKKGLAKQFEPYLTRIETDFSDLRETFLRSSVSGLNLAVVFHEVERGVRVLHTAAKEGGKAEILERQARDLVHMLDGFSVLLRRDNQKSHGAYELIDRARQINLLRFSHHKIKLVVPEAAGSDTFEATFAFNLALGALSNLIDNAIYWLRVRWPDTPAQARSGRRLYVGPSKDLTGGPCIVVADNGPGFGEDDPAQLTQPFFTRKPDGMGLGLYYTNLVMELAGGRLVFPRPNDIDLPDGFDGAIVAMQFPKEK